MNNELADIHRRRLEWVANAKPGMAHNELFPMNDWGSALSASVQAALDYIAYLEQRLEMHTSDDR